MGRLCMTQRFLMNVTRTDQGQTSPWCTNAHASCILQEDISLECWHFTKSPIFLSAKVNVKVNFQHYKLEKEYTI